MITNMAIANMDRMMAIEVRNTIVVCMTYSLIDKDPATIHHRVELWMAGWTMVSRLVPHWVHP